MSHIFGIAHSIGGIVEQIGGLFGGAPSASPPLLNNFGPTGSGGFGGGGTTPPVIFDEFGNQFDPPSGGGGSCGPSCGPTTKRYITTVCPDGSVKTREAKSRRRKRRLATVSDIKDLASLKTVLGGGKAFENWIATRGR